MSYNEAHVNLTNMQTTKKGELTVGMVGEKYGMKFKGVNPDLSVSEYLKQKGHPYMAKLISGKRLNEE